MIAFILRWSVDLWLFSAIALSATLLTQRWLFGRGHGRLPRAGVLATIAIVLAALPFTASAGRRESDNLARRLEGLAPTYAQEVQLMGHSKIALDTAGDDPTYLKIIDAEIRWEKVNPNVNDIYTYRRQADGQIAFVADSETDYDRNGTFEGEREQRTEIGEIYDDTTPAFIRALDGVACLDDSPVTDRWGTWISAYVPLLDEHGNVEAALGVDFDAADWNRSILRSRVDALGVAGVVLVIVIAASVIVAITRSESLKRETMQRELLKLSRQAGMAEVATGVLHNVGNVLNSVNTCAGVIADKVRSSKVGGLGKAAEIIRSNRADFGHFVTEDARGKMLPDYLIQLSSTLDIEQEEILGELTQLGRNLEHVKQIVASQQSLAKHVNIVETFEVADVVEDALRLNDSVIRQSLITVERNQLAGPPISADRHLVLQILSNLVANAAHAMRNASEKRLTFRVGPSTTADGQAGISITVTDTGMGIAPDEIDKLFNHGHTTKSEGHGFGLHHSAIAAHNMGGRMSASSPGIDRGATFTLVIPLETHAPGEVCQMA